MLKNIQTVAFKNVYAKCRTNNLIMEHIKVLH